MVAVFPGILPASMEVAPYSPSALANARIVPMQPATCRRHDHPPENLPLRHTERLRRIDQVHIHLFKCCSCIPVHQWKCNHSCRDHASCPGLYDLDIKCRIKTRSTVLLVLKMSNGKNPATVGGSTSGSVRIPSSTALRPVFAFSTFLAAHIPRKNDTIVAAIPVLIEMKSGLQSSPARICLISSISFLFYSTFVSK